MLEEDRCMEIRILKQQGKSERQISRLTGHSRTTVRKYLASDEAPAYQCRPGRSSKLDPYKGYMLERIKATLPHRLPATVLCREIKALGYPGGQRIVNTFVAAQFPASLPDPVVRFETLAGQQMQVDWCVFRRGAAPLSAFVATLGFSRYTYVEFVSNERFDTLKACHEHAFTYFQGVPKDALYDNMRTVILARDAYGDGQHQFHSGLWDMAKHFGFTPRVCRPYRAQTKGKVERFNRYLRNSFYYPLVSRLAQSGLHLDVATANAEVLKWLRDVANARVHKTLNKVPAKLWAEELPALQRLPLRVVVDTVEITQPAVTAWPTSPLQRSPAEYDRLLQEGGL